MNLIKKYKEKATELVKQMTLEEKASFCSGESFWYTKSCERLGIKHMMLTDGPHGLRKQAASADHLGINQSIPATCFPTASAVASSFDDKLLFEMGEALGEECLENEVSVLLGPGINIKRNPLCGRNFEYFSEDPYLTGKLGKSFVDGVQSKNIGVSVKHYLANNQEKARLVSDSVIDERALNEIYLPGFEEVVKKSNPATMMCSYNKINGTYASENHHYMTEVLREKWGFDGLVVTDWGAICDRVTGVKAGIDLEMPSSGGRNDAKIVKAVLDGTLDEKMVEACAVNVVALILATTNNQKINFDRDAHNNLARKIARESAVLLQNNGILPLDKSKKLAVVGLFAKTPRYQGAGSSKINPTKITSLCDELDAQDMAYTYASGYSEKDEVDYDLIKEAVDVAKGAENVICALGLPDGYESEGFDRAHMKMPESYSKLIEEISKVNPNIVVVLHLGSPIETEWKKDVAAVLNMYLGGQNVGGATYDLLFGDYSPCGRLAETFPLSYSDVATSDYYGKDNKVAAYNESIYVGYRYYDTFDVDVAFPFGYGLSYTNFEYSNIQVEENTVKVDVTNIGDITAKEVVQLYIQPGDSKIYKAKKELKAYTKIELEPNETKTVSFELDDRSFAFYNVSENEWTVENGKYSILIGKNVKDILLSAEILIDGRKEIAIPCYKESAPSYYNKTNDMFSDDEFEVVLGGKIPVYEVGKPFDLSHTLGDISITATGKNLKEQIKNQLSQNLQGDILDMFLAMLEDMPLRSLPMIGGDALNDQVLEGVLQAANAE